MRFRKALLSAFLVLLVPAFIQAQTATCTNWQFFNAPSSPTGTIAEGINRWGTVVGAAAGANSSEVGFIRYSNGSLKTYSFQNFPQTHLTRRSALGLTVGYVGPSPYQGLALSGSNAITVNYPGAGDTVILGVNYWGTMVGIFGTGAFYNPYDGFKLKNNVFTVIHYAGAVNTNPTSISDKGVIVGWYQNSGYHKYHGFTLVNGVHKTLDHPKAVYGTFLNDINGSGVIVGKYVDGSFQDHTFIYINGTFKDVLVPNFSGQTITGINGYNYVTGRATNNSTSTSFTAHCQ